MDPNQEQAFIDGLEENKQKLKDVDDQAEIDRILFVQQELKKSEKQFADMLGIVIPK